jgi:hypothetical protein
MNTGLIVVFALAVPFLWMAAFTDRKSYSEAVKLKELITEILLSIAEWENDKLTVFKILTLKAYPPNLINRLKLIRGYAVIRFAIRLPRKRRVEAASTILQQFCECIWISAPGFRAQAEVMAREIKRLLT